MTVPVIPLGPGGNVIDMVDMIEDINRQGMQYELLGFSAWGAWCCGTSRHSRQHEERQ